jgi:cysteine-rich repeat protein
MFPTVGYRPAFLYFSISANSGRQSMPLAKEKIRMIRILLALAIFLAVPLLAPLSASAACGDSILDTAEQCDDGNSENGDCCSDECLWEPQGQSCGGSACSTAGTCNNGACTDVEDLCSDGIACTIDLCDPASGECTFLPKHEFCDDELFCNGAEYCSLDDGCTDGNPPECATLNGACAEFSCDENLDRCEGTSLLSADCDEDGDGISTPEDLCRGTSESASPAFFGCSHVDLLRSPGTLLEPANVALERAVKLIGSLGFLQSFERKTSKISKFFEKTNSSLALGKPCIGDRLMKKAVALIYRIRSQLNDKAPRFARRDLAEPIAGALQDVSDLEMGKAYLRLADSALAVAQDTAATAAEQMAALCESVGAKQKGDGVIQEVNSASGAITLDSGLVLTLPASSKSRKRPDLGPGSRISYEGFGFSDAALVATKIRPEAYEPRNEMPTPISSDPFDCLDLRIRPFGSSESYPLSAYQNWEPGSTFVGKLVVETEAELVNQTPFQSTCPAYDAGIGTTSCLSVSATLSQLAKPKAQHSIPYLGSGSSASLTGVVPAGEAVMALTVTRREWNNISANPCAGAPTDKQTIYLPTRVEDYGGFCTLDYSQTRFVLEDVAFNVGDSVNFDQFGVSSLDGTTLDPRFGAVTTAARAEGYLVAAPGSGSSSFPSVQTINEGNSFAVFRNHDFYPSTDPACDPMWDEIFGFLGSGVRKRSGLRWPHVLIENNGETARYGCGLPDIRRDLLSLCLANDDAYYRLPWYPTHDPEAIDGLQGWTYGQGNYDDPNFGHGKMIEDKNGTLILNPTPLLSFQRYAWDFGANEGAPIRAARGGRAILINESSTVNDSSCWGADASTVPNKFATCDPGNYVFVRHEDRSIAVYWHMKPEGVSVDKCDELRRGDVLGEVGNTGNSTADHLHFHVQDCDTYPPDCGLSREVVFNNPAGSCDIPRWLAPVNETPKSSNCSSPAAARPCSPQ